MLLVGDHLLLGWVLFALNLVAYDPIFVNQRAEDKVSCLLLD